MSSIKFTDLPDEIRRAHSPRVLSKGEILLQQGKAAEFIYFVIHGQLRLVSFIEQQMVTHYFVEASELFGESALYIPTYACTAIAETPSQVIAIPVDAFATTLKDQPHLSERYLAHLTHRFASVKSLLELRSINSSRVRLLRYLMPRLAPGQYTLTLDKPLRVVASELSLSPEALSRTLSRLEAEGAITRQRRMITFSSEWLEDVAEY